VRDARQARELPNRQAASLSRIGNHARKPAEIGGAIYGSDVRHVPTQ
jgi:hypothetical protein